MTLLDSPPDVSTRSAEPGSWSLLWRGHRLDESELTGQHLSVLSLITGTDDFRELEIDPRHGHQRLMMLLAVIEIVAKTEAMGAGAGEDAIAGVITDAMASVASAPATEILGALRLA